MNPRQKKYLIILVVSFGALTFSIIGTYLLLAPRWTQVAYSRLDWETFGGIYEYPKTQPYTLDYILPIIISAWTLIGAYFLIYVLKGMKKDRIKAIWKVLSVFFLVVLFGSGGVGAYFGVEEWEFYAYDVGPYITWGNGESGATQDPTSEITICWHSEYLATSKLRYGLDPENLDQTAASSSDGFGRFHKVPLSGLTPNTTYYYKVKNFPTKQFTTAPDTSFNYTFFLWADPRTNDGYDSAINQANLPKYMSEHAAADGTDVEFSICAGDITSRGVDYKTWKLWLSDITTNDFASNRSHMVAFGNHERHDDEGMVNLPNYYPCGHSNPRSFSDTCYSFNYGDVHFSLLDRWDYDDPWWGGDDDAHAQWLEDDLIANSDKKFKILVMHPNPVLGDSHSGDCESIVEVAKDNDVDVIFCGHWHSYSTRDFNGDYISSAGCLTVIEKADNFSHL